MEFGEFNSSSAESQEQYDIDKANRVLPIELVEWESYIYREKTFGDSSQPFAKDTIIYYLQSTDLDNGDCEVVYVHMDDDERERVKGSKKITMAADGLSIQRTPGCDFLEKGYLLEPYPPYDTEPRYLKAASEHPSNQ